MPLSDFRPFSVRLGQHAISVKYEKGRPKTKGLYGLCKTTKRSGISIHLWDKGRRSRWSTLWHELLHAASEVTDAKLTERQVVRLELAFKELCRSNPALMRKMVRSI